MRWRKDGSGRNEVGDVTSDVGNAPKVVRDFLDDMSDEERMLVVLNRELYEGDWDEMVADLKGRLEGKPYIFKLAHRIADDLERIERLRGFEHDTGLRLAEYVKLD